MIITLCGSAKFENGFHKWNKELSLVGHVVLDLAVHPSFMGGNKDWYTKEQKEILDEVHKKKIDLSDAIFVVTKNYWRDDSYLGESTGEEILYAQESGKVIFFDNNDEQIKRLLDPNISWEEETENLTQIEKIDKIEEN